MSANTAHANNGVLIHAGEYILLYSDNVTMEFSGQDNGLFKGSKQGRIYLTTHRMIFNNKNQSDSLLSFSFPFVTISDVDIEQPTFSANYIRGKVRAQPNGNWIGEAKFKLYFKAGGAIDFGQAMLRAARMAQRNSQSDAPPPYTPPSSGWYEAPPPAYQPAPGYYGWLPNTQEFNGGPPPNSVFMTDNPPPYPGINPTGPQQGYVPNGGYPQGGYQEYPGNAPPGYPGSQQPGGFQGYPGVQPGYPAPQSGYPGAQPQTGYPGYPGVQSPTGGFTGFPGGAPPNTGYQNYPGGAPVPQQAGYPGYPGGAPGYPQGHMGFTAGHSTQSKEAEAAQSAYYDPNQPQTAYVPPPAYYEPPPSYNTLGNKKQN